jgi:siroheme synthase (precorrin-2 oxidase/ferrochelatase)
MSDVSTTTKQTTRLTVDLADDDYQILKVAVATAGKGVTLSSVVRQLIHEHLESLRDEADRALVNARRDSPTLSGQDVRTRFAQRRLQAMQ